MKTKQTLIDVSKLKTIKREKVVVRVAAWMWWQRHGDVGGYDGDGGWEMGMRGAVDDEGGVTVVDVVWRRGDDGCGVASVGGGDDDGSDGVRLKKMMVVAGPWPESGRNMAGKKGRRRKNNMERGKCLFSL
ncbi:hypothetical protein Tco_0145925 [Tanacetum coccineum]